jgi:CRP-like cAMP-binding protein
LVLEPDENSYSNGSGSGRGTRNAASDAKAAGRMRLGGLLEEKVVEEEEEEETDEQKAEKLARAARIRALSGGKRQVSRVAPSKTTCDPVLMTREYDEQFVHPMDSGYVNQAKIASATETFREMDRNMSGQLSKGDLHRVFAQERERHLAATRALAVMAAKEEEEEALRSGMQQQQVGNAAAAAQRSTASSTDDDDDDTKAAAAAAAAAAAVSGSDVTLSPGGGPKRMKKVKRMKKAGEGRDRGRQNRGPPAGGRGSNDGGSPAAAGGGGGGGNEEEPLLLIPPASADSPGGESLSEREVRKLALQSMKVMRIDIGLRTEAQAKLVLDWVGSVPFFQKNAPNEDAMGEISKEVVATTYKEGEDIVVEGETGDAFYAILSGDVDVIVNGKNVGQMTVPQSFGDRALESDDVRGATIRATTEVTCARLTRESYHSSIERVSEAEEAMAHQSESHENAALEESIRIADYAAALMTMGLPLEQRSNVQNRNLEEWVGTITYFKMNARTAQHRIEIAKALQPTYFMDGEEVFHQGDIGDAFFCIMQGEVEIEVDGKSVGTLTPGKCFGDRALEAEEGGEPDRRAATITALGDITLARLSADAYHACIDRVMMAASATPRAATRAEDDLEALAKAAAEHPLSVISGLTNEERIALGGCETFNGSRVLIAQSWVAQAIVRRRHAGGLQVDPPVLATGVFRNFQCANDAYFQCKKIIDTPFPYPYAQAVLLMLCLYTVIAPFMICQIVNSTPWAIAISFITVGILVTMNEVARGLEEPFGSGDESNKIAVDALHMDFNENLWCLTQKVYKRYVRTLSISSAL